MDLFSSNVLTGVVNSLQGIGPNSIVNRFFPNLQTEESEEIHFDVMADVMGLAPFVMPTVEGKVMTEQGYTTKTFKPAYVKPKTPFDPGSALKRIAGEPITGNLQPMDRMRVRIANTLGVQRKLIDNRLELMAVEALRLGQITVSGDQYPTTVVNYGRDAALTITLAGGSKWGDAGVKVLDTLQDTADQVQTKSGSVPFDVVMELGAWKKFRVDADVKEAVANRARSGVTESRDAINQAGLTFQLSIDGFNIYTYQGLYKDSTGTVTRVLPNGTVLMVGDLLGYKAFGAIQDEAAGIQAVPYFSKSWVTEDPGRRFVMTQSAPLVVPYRPNASACITVL